MRQPCRVLRRFSVASSDETSLQSPDWWRSRSSPGSWPASTSAFSAAGVATMRPRGKCGAAMLGPPRADGRERFFELGGGDLLPAPPCEQREPAPTVAGQGGNTTAATPPNEVASGAVAGAMLYGRYRRGRGVDQADEIIAGDIGVDPIAERLFFPVKPRLKACSVELARCPRSKKPRRQRGTR